MRSPPDPLMGDPGLVDFLARGSHDLSKLTNGYIDGILGRDTTCLYAEFAENVAQEQDQIDTKLHTNTRQRCARQTVYLGVDFGKQMEWRGAGVVSANHTKGKTEGHCIVVYNVLREGRTVRCKIDQIESLPFETNRRFRNHSAPSLSWITGCRSSSRPGFGHTLPLQKMQKLHSLLLRQTRRWTAQLPEFEPSAAETGVKPGRFASPNVIWASALKDSEWLGGLGVSSTWLMHASIVCSFYGNKDAFLELGKDVGDRRFRLVIIGRLIGEREGRIGTWNIVHLIFTNPNPTTYGHTSNSHGYKCSTRMEQGGSGPIRPSPAPLHSDRAQKWEWGDRVFGQHLKFEFEELIAQKPHGNHSFRALQGNLNDSTPLSFPWRGTPMFYPFGLDTLTLLYNVVVAPVRDQTLGPNDCLDDMPRFPLLAMYWGQERKRGCPVYAPMSKSENLFYLLPGRVSRYLCSKFCTLGPPTDSCLTSYLSDEYHTYYNRYKYMAGGFVALPHPVTSTRTHYNYELRVLRLLGPDMLRAWACQLNAALCTSHGVGGVGVHVFVPATPSPYTTQRMIVGEQAMNLCIVSQSLVTKRDAFPSIWVAHTDATPDTRYDNMTAGHKEPRNAMACSLLWV
ncbi:hypothetical protein ACRALDRAFT_213110 [Sodiomyces alcalophilus JCM 7366]|uniref:uncharacterized protein n=1 Tax=Sodiomyces alcalophilus JCM 7366 TaxID=591952 RepID=UPI0039B37A98